MYSFSVKAKDAAGNLSAATVISVQTAGVYVAPVNIALKKPSYSSTSNSTANLGNDGDLTTKCSGATGNTPWWYLVNLGAFYNITGIEIVWTHPEWINKYKIEVSKDSITWDMALNKTANTYFGGTSEINNFTTNGYKYIRNTVTGFGNGGYWPSIIEFKVYGTLSITGTNELYNSKVKVFPNPTNDYLKIETAKSKSDIVVMTMNGTIIYAKNSANHNFTIPVTDWKKGIYMVRIKDEDGVAVEKVIVQ
jgi:hypothetical protein